MENNTRRPFKKYKELRVYFTLRTYALKQYDYECDIDRPFDWFKFSSRGVIIKDKNSGMEIHFKYSSVDSVGDNSRALILEDVELFTPFIKEDDKIKFITWKEWDKPFKAINDIVVPWDERLSEHGTDLEYILSKTLLACETASFITKANFKQNVGYRADEHMYYISMVYGDCYCRDKNGDRYHIKHNYYASENTFNVSIQHLGECNGTHEISFKFDDKHSLEGMKIKHGSMDGILRFMDIDNSGLREYIIKTRDYINAKLTENQLTSRINTSTEEDMYSQTWNFSPRVDVRPYTESIRKAHECAKAYNIDTDVESTEYSTIWEYLNTKMTGLNTWMIKKGEPFKFEYNYGPFKKTEIVNVRTVENNSFINLLLQSTDMRAVETVYNMEITITFDDIGNIKDYAMINKELIDKFEEKNIINLLNFLEEMCPDLLTFTFTLNKYGDIYTQIKNECDWIYNHHTDGRNRISTCSGYVLSVSSGMLLDKTREKIHFQFDTFGAFHRITIQILDPNREKLKVTIGIEDSQLVSIAVNPGFDNFEKKIDDIYNPRVKRLVSEIFNKLYKGEE